jgi:hypothetical protein
VENLVPYTTFAKQDICAQDHGELKGMMWYNKYLKKKTKYAFTFVFLKVMNSSNDNPSTKPNAQCIRKEIHKLVNCRIAQKKHFPKP